MTKPKCIVMVGLPASGKSTRVRELLAVNPIVVYSTDNLIEEWAAEDGKTYNEMFNDWIKRATDEMNQLLDFAIRSRQDIVWDQTNLSAKKRAKIINRMRNAGYSVECECFVFPQGDSQWEDWNHRLRSRPGKTIPDTVLESMMDSFVQPTVDEGFDAVRCYDIYGNLL